jgi:hypothetical protein
MAYNFTFDLSKLSRKFFKDIAAYSEKKKIYKKMGNATKFLVDKFKVEQMTGLPVSDSVTVIEDLIDTQISNLSTREAFLKSKKRALFLPHCSRKYMDSQCKAKFDPGISSYFCMSCSPDCLVNQATRMAKARNYDVYRVPGGSAIKNIMQKKSYDGVVGVACTEETKLGLNLLKHVGIAGQAVPLIKNGCSATMFNLETLSKTL